MNKPSRFPVWAIILIVVLVLLCCCTVLFAVGVPAAVIGWLGFNADSTEPFEYDFDYNFEITPFYDEDEFPFDLDQPTEEPPAMNNDPVSEGAFETLDTLETVIVPINDPLELAERLQGRTGIPETYETTPPSGVGAVQDFWVTNVDTNDNFQVTAELQYAGENLYFWIEQGVRFDEDELNNLAQTFDESIYQTNREFFGSEWRPGVDGDDRLYILYAGGLGYNLAGYFSSADSLHPDAHEYSNAHEMFLLNSDNIGLGEEFTYGVLAHEFQHMIHWYRDRNEESWLNEGFSELASFLNGYDAGGFDYLYTSDPDLQLNDWPNDPNATSPHYGAGFLFTTYFLDRFGEDATKELVANEDNGMDSVDGVLNAMSITDPETGEGMTADNFFGDWVVATYLNDASYGDGRFVYTNYSGLFPPEATETVSDCPLNTQSRSVNQYGVDYIEITCSGPYTIQFQGSQEVGILEEDAYSGEYAFWSNKGDESDMKLTREFDFSDVSGPITLTFNTWYDLEEDYDYLYLLVSEDGESWDIIETPSGTDEDPSGNSYGWGYNGVSGGWFEESVDLSAYAGKQVQVRFEYVTDAAVNGEGMLIDDITIPEIDYSSDLESDDGGWVADGFVRVQNRLPQTFVVSIIHQDGSNVVERIELNDDQSFIYQGEGDVVLVVSGTTRFTRQKAVYEFSIE